MKRRRFGCFHLSFSLWTMVWFIPSTWKWDKLVRFYLKNTLMSYRYHYMIWRTHRKHKRNLKLARVGKVTRVAALSYIPRGKTLFISCLVLLTNSGNLKTYFSVCSKLWLLDWTIVHLTTLSVDNTYKVILILKRPLWKDTIILQFKALSWGLFWSLWKSDEKPFGVFRPRGENFN
jgi:hypothetical protein